MSYLDGKKTSENNSHIREILEALPYSAVAVTGDVIVHANNKCKALSHFRGKNLKGLKPGEAFGCREPSLMNSVCGGGDGCVNCGLRMALDTALREGSSEGECGIITAEGSVTRLKVVATAFTAGGENCVLVCFRDISAERAAEVFLKRFSTVSMDVSDYIKARVKLMEGGKELSRETAPMLEAAAERLAVYTRQLKILQNAAAGRYHPIITNVTINNLVSAFKESYGPLHGSLEKGLVFETGNEAFKSDKMVILAIMDAALIFFEAVRGEADINFFIDKSGDDVFMRIKTPVFLGFSFMAETYKTSDRNMPEYNMSAWIYCVKLLTETCLGGLAFFRTEPENGTTLTVKFKTV